MEDVRQVRLARLLGDAQAQRDQLVRHSRADQAQDLLLALGQLGGAVAGPGEHRRCGFGVQRRLAARGGADAAQQLVGLGVLEQVPDRAGVDGIEDPAAVGERGEHHDAHAGGGRPDAPGGLDPVELRHREVHQRDVGARRGDELDPLPAVAGGTRELHVAHAGEQLLEPRADNVMIVDYGHADHVAGSLTVRRVPLCGALSTRSSPPPSWTRSSSARRPKWPLTGRRRSSSGESPWPSSSTRSWTWPSRRCSTTRAVSAAAWDATLRTPPWAARNSSAPVAGGSWMPRGASSATRKEGPAERVVRSESAATRPSRWRLGG